MIEAQSETYIFHVSQLVIMNYIQDMIKEVIIQNLLVRLCSFEKPPHEHVWSWQTEIESQSNSPLTSPASNTNPINTMIHLKVC